MHSKSSSETTFSLCNSILFKTNCSATKVGQQGSIRRTKFKRYTNIIKFSLVSLLCKEEMKVGGKRKESKKKEKRKRGRGGKTRQERTTKLKQIKGK